MMSAALLDGQPSDHLPLSDRGLHYGDGVFRTLHVQAGKARAWATHYQRLRHDCQRLSLPVPALETLQSECTQLFADHADGVLKIIVTRGSGGRGYLPPTPACARRLLLRYPLPDYTQQRASGVAVDICSIRLGRNQALAGIKHLNRLEQVLARRECQATGHVEALMLDARDNVISGTMSNLFVMRNNLIHTPDLTFSGVAGATRQRLLIATAVAGRSCREATLSVADCRCADELFLCNSLAGVWPIVRLGAQAFPIGPITRWCQKQLELG